MRVWLLSDYDNRKHHAFRGLIYQYRSHIGKSTEIHIEVKSRSSLWRSLFAHLRDAANNPLPDVMELPLNWTARFSSLGLLTDLKPHIKTLSENAYPDYVMEELCRHGDAQIYSVPWWQKAPALHYRIDVLEKFSSNPASDLSTWDGFMGMLSRLASSPYCHNNRLLAVPGSSGAIGLGEVLPRIRGRRGGLYSDDFTRATFTRDETSGGILDWISLADNGYIQLFSQDRFENGYKPRKDCVFMLTSRRPKYLDTGMSMLPYPGCSNGGSLLLVNNLAVSSSSSCKKEAISLVSWLSDSLNAGTFADYFGVFPSIESALDMRIKYESEPKNNNVVELRLARERGMAIKKIFLKPELLPNFSFYPSAEMLLQRILWRISLQIAKCDFRHEDLRKELINAQGEADYLLTLG